MILSRFPSFRELARRRLPRFVFDFIDGGSGSENTLAENRSALDRIRLLGSAPTNVSGCSQSVTLFGESFRHFPVIIGPTGLAGAAWPRGDVDLARAASDRNIPFVMSSAATATMEEVADAGDGAKMVPALSLQGPRGQQKAACPGADSRLQGA
jgi:(S)-mandelate dehydrogenase